MTFLIQYRRLKIDKVCIPFRASPYEKMSPKKLIVAFEEKQVVWSL